MEPSGFTNSFTAGELDEDAWDRVDLQPVEKGCQTAQNYVIRIAGPLGKRRGFWLNAPISDQAHLARMIPFRKSLTDAVVLEFGNSICHVWQTNGAPLLNGGVQVNFATPWTDVQLAGLRYKQIGDVIYFRHSGGLAPEALVRTSNTSWAFNVTSFKNGPWLAENTDLTLTLSFTAGSVADGNGTTGYGVMMAPQAGIAIVASKAFFTAGMVGAQLRVRASNGSASARSWVAGRATPVGWYALYNGNVYISTADGGVDQDCLTPPVQTQGAQGDGDCMFNFVTDGAGIVQITGFTDATHATCSIVTNVPLLSGQATSYFAQAAYSALNGWPTAWPEIREERLVDGATASNLDFVDLTQTAGFSPTMEDFTPGTGTGVVVDTNAIRRRVGVSGAQILWFNTATYLVCGTTDGEYLIAGSVLDEPLSPSAITIKTLSNFGSADVCPVRAHSGLLFVCSAGQTLREINIDNQQGATGEDHSFLAQHIAVRGFAQLAWVKDPDNACWLRLADGGLACFTYHKEQAVKGFTTQLPAAGFTVLDEIVMPGPGNRETLWLLAKQTFAGVTKTFILMQSQPTDALFMDAAQIYAGAAVNQIGNLANFNGQAMDVLDTAGGGVWYPQLVVAGGKVTLPNGATTTAAQVGFTFPTYFKSLKLNLRTFNGALLQLQDIKSALVDLKTAGCTVGLDDGSGEEVAIRRAVDVPGLKARRISKEVTLVRDTDFEDADRDPRIVIQEQSPYDMVIYALKPNRVVAGD